MILKSAQTAKVGKIFKDARLRKSLSLIEVSAETVINIEYIRAIEAGDYSIFPARTYAVQYFEKYANFLSINPRFFDIYNTDVLLKAEKEEKLGASQEPFLEKNQIFTSLLVILTLTAIIYLIMSKDPISNKSVQILENPIILNTLDINAESVESRKYEIEELNNQIHSFLYKDTLNKNNVNVYSREPDA